MANTNLARTGAMAAAGSRGAGNVASYQMSSDPFFRLLAITSSTVTTINFPYVTRFVEITNHTTGSVLRIAATANGASNVATANAYYALSGAAVNGVPGKFGPFEIRIKSL